MPNTITDVTDAVAILDASDITGVADDTSAGNWPMRVGGTATASGGQAGQLNYRSSGTGINNKPYVQQTLGNVNGYTLPVTSDSTTHHFFAVLRKKARGNDAGSFLWDTSTGRLVIVVSRFGETNGATQDSLQFYDSDFRSFNALVPNNNFHLYEWVFDEDTETAKVLIDGTQVGDTVAYAPTTIGGTVRLMNESGGSFGASSDSDIAQFRHYSAVKSGSALTAIREEIYTTFFPSLAAADTTKPTVTGAVLAANGTTLTITYSEVTKGSTGFTPKVGGTAVAFTTPSRITAALTQVLTLSAPVLSSGVVTLDFTPGNVTDNATSVNTMNAFTALSVTNNSTVSVAAPTSGQFDATRAIDLDAPDLIYSMAQPNAVIHGLKTNDYTAVSGYVGNFDPKYLAGDSSSAFPFMKSVTGAPFGGLALRARDTGTYTYTGDATVYNYADSEIKPVLGLSQAGAVGSAGWTRFVRVRFTSADITYLLSNNTNLYQLTGVPGYIRTEASGGSVRLASTGSGRSVPLVANTWYACTHRLASNSYEFWVDNTLVASETLDNPGAALEFENWDGTSGMMMGRDTGVRHYEFCDLTLYSTARRPFDPLPSTIDSSTITVNMAQETGEVLNPLLRGFISRQNTPTAAIDAQATIFRIYDITTRVPVSTTAQSGWQTRNGRWYNTAALFADMDRRAGKFYLNFGFNSNLTGGDSVSYPTDLALHTAINLDIL
ncbi:MAG: hypothetical protein V4671_30420, partial [Armatimonadota bacterium]